MKSSFRIAIAGSGVSGLAAAVEFARAQSERRVELTLFDERQSPGGRTRSFVDTTSGDTIDNGQHIMLGCYTSTLRFLKQIGSEKKLRVERSLTIPYYKKNEGAFGLFSVGSNLPVPVNLLTGLLASDLLEVFEKMAAIRFGLGVLLFRYDKDFANKTCKQLFIATHQPDSLIEKLWEPVILATLNASAADASAQVFLNVIRIVFLTDRRFANLAVPTCGLSELLIDPAVELLRSNGHSLRFGEEIISADERSGLVYLCTNKTNGFETFDALIVATSPLPEWANEFSEIPTSLRFSPIVNLYLWLDKKILGSPINGFLGTTLQWAFPKPSVYSNQLLACTVSAAQHLIDEEPNEIVRIIESDLRSAIGSESDFHILHSLVLKEKRATYLLDPNTETSRPRTQTNSSAVRFATDFAANGLPMTIEGAVRNGSRAAKSILNDFLFIQIPETH